MGRARGTDAPPLAGARCARNAAFVWLASAIAGAFSLRSWGGSSPRSCRSARPAMLVLAVACLMDVIIALLIVARWRRGSSPGAGGDDRRCSVAATLLWPSLWAGRSDRSPKHSILAAALALGAIEEDR